MTKPAMIAICTRYIGATNTRPSRIKAYTSNPGQSVLMSKCSAEFKANPSQPAVTREDQVHRIVAQALADRMSWGPLGPCGGIKHGYAFVFTQ